MIKNILLLLTTGILLSQCSSEKDSSIAKLIEKVEKEEGKVVIPYEKYELPNGLTVLVHEDHSDPIVHVNVTYHVGSAREEIGRSGFAHFFEHMMFQGSDNVGDEQHFKTVSTAGGTLNGTTNDDRTNYFETMPSNYLETALWLEADRMGFLLDAVSQEKFEVQRATVKNERGQRIDNAPYGLAGEIMAKALYPYGHPYSWPVIGYLKDLDSASVQDLKNFFLRWYGPNNAVLIVAGDVDVKHVMKLVEKYYASIPRGPEAKPMEKQNITIDADRYVSYEDNYIRFPEIRMTFPTVNGRHEDEAPLDVLASILGGGKTSILYKNLVKSQKALMAFAYNPARELTGNFTIQARPFPGTNLADLESIIRSSIKEFEERGVSEEDLQRVKAQMENRSINSLATVSGKAAQLASYHTFYDNPNLIQAELDRYNNVTKKDVLRVYNKYIKDKPAVILSVYPKGGKDLIAKEDNFTVPTDGNHESKEVYDTLKYVKAVDSFDRSVMPQAIAAPALSAPNYWETSLDNGIKAIGIENNEIPVVEIQINVACGHLLESTDKSKAGIASLLANMLNESTKNYSTEAISNELEQIGSHINIGSDNENISISVQSLTKNLDKTLEILQEKMFNPAFLAEDFDRKKQQKLKAIANKATKPTSIAKDVFLKLLYGNEHIRAIPASGTIESVTSISLKDIKAYYDKNFSPSIAEMIVVGDISQADILKKLNFLNKWEVKEVILPTEPSTPEIAKTTIYLIDQPGAAQSVIRMGFMSLPYDATGDYYKASLTNYALGGAFNSRINLNLRENKGYTYGARSSFTGMEKEGVFSAGASVKKDATDLSIIEFLKELKGYKVNGITDEELEFTKNSIKQQKALAYETPRQKAGFLSRIIKYSLDKSYLSKQNDIVTNITKEEIDAIAKKYLKIDNMAILVVGDKATTLEGLKKLGYDIVELDKKGNPI